MKTLKHFPTAIPKKYHAIFDKINNLDNGVIFGDIIMYAQGALRRHHYSCKKCNSFCRFNIQTRKIVQVALANLYYPKNPEYSSTMMDFSLWITKEGLNIELPLFAHSEFHFRPENNEK